MRFEPLPLPGAWVIRLERHSDERGSFARAFCEREFSEHGLPTRFPQCNLSSNRSRGTLRGMHFNAHPFGEAKLVRCVRGAVHDVIVDLRAESPTRLQWIGLDLTADGGEALFVPPGFAHGFITLDDETDVFYHMGEFFRPDAARGFRWDDDHVGIEWPIEPTVISARDATYPDLDPDSIEA